MSANLVKDGSVKNGIHKKSPQHSKRKRFLSTQARRSFILKKKIESLEYKLSESSENIFSLKLSGRNQHPCNPDISNELLETNISQFPESSQLRRSLSFPMVHLKNNSSSLTFLNKKSSLSNQMPSNIATDISSCEIFPAGCSAASDEMSRRSSTVTVLERNNSTDSTFSQISVTEALEANEFYKTWEKPSKWKAQHSRSKSDVVIEQREQHSDDVLSLPNSFSESNHCKSIFEGKQVTVPTECFFPQPRKGQSLTSFLSSNDFSISAELDRENAHFCISEALISAMEHMRCSRIMKLVEEEDESDEEIRKLTQRIRIRRREKQRERTIKSAVLLSDGKTDTSQSGSPPNSSHSSEFEADSIGSEDEVEDLELSNHTDSNLSSIKESGLSLSMASLYSDADIQKANRERDTEKKLQDSETSAESVALSLLRRFSEKHLPKASELKWIVSEQEAPQRLLPLPDSWPVSPDAIEEEYKTRLRGNFEWAPPRPQIIFSILPSIKRKDILEKQRYKCAGCGLKIEKNYVNRFRYCNYFGKYFCQCCHSNTPAYIPGRILWKWDFTKYYVSRFASELLEQMFSDFLFNVQDVNRSLYRKSRQLDQCRVSRMQLFYLKDFIRTCRNAENIQVLLEKQNHHILYEPHMYSINTFIQVKSGEMLKQLRFLITPCLEHIKHCILCQAKGFICEICQKEKDIIFPFQFDRVILCTVCGACFHKNCLKNNKCPRCVRISERKSRLKGEI